MPQTTENLDFLPVPKMTQGDVAKILGISRVRVHQLEQVALKKLARDPMLRQLAIDAGIIPERDGD